MDGFYGPPFSPEEVSTPWVRFFAAEWKPHWVHSSLVTPLAEDAKRRWHEFVSVEPMPRGHPEAFLDLPGMVMQDRTYQDFQVDGLHLRLPTQDVYAFREELESGRLRTFQTGEKYYKLHGWLNCLVLSEVQGDALRAQIEARWPEIEAAAKAEDEEFIRRIREVNKGEVKVVSPRDPESLKGFVEKKLVSQPNEEMN